MTSSWQIKDPPTANKNMWLVRNPIAITDLVYKGVYENSSTSMEVLKQYISYVQDRPMGDPSSKVSLDNCNNLGHGW